MSKKLRAALSARYKKIRISRYGEVHGMMTVPNSTVDCWVYVGSKRELEAKV